MKIIVFDEDGHSLLYILIIKKGIITPLPLCLKSQRTMVTQPEYLVSKYLAGSFSTNTIQLDGLSERMHKKTDETYLCNELCNNLNVKDRTFKIDRVFFSAFVKELAYSQIYKKSVLNNFRNVFKLKQLFMPNTVVISLESKCLVPIDYSWSNRCLCLVLERMHLDSLMSWLSTLGGAFSALGDYDLAFAEKASVTSYKQMIIACRLGDTDLIARCWLYCALSLIQKKKFKKAGRIIKYVYSWAKSQPEGKVDYRILKMSQGIWTKLKYEHSLNLSHKNRTKCSSRQI